MSIQYGFRSVYWVNCSACHSGGPDGDSRTRACDRAKDDGWNITGNDRALCPDCDNDESIQEGEI